MVVKLTPVIKNHTLTNSSRYRIELPSDCVKKLNSIGFCNTVPVVPNNYWDIDMQSIENDRLRISIRTVIKDNIIEFKSWLSQNPTTVYYELAEPIIEELDETLQLKSFDVTTHITSDNYLLPITSAKIPSNVQAVVSSLITENKELTNEVSTLSVENEELKQTNEIQDELIDINMCATDEIYVLLEPLLAQSISTMSLEREVSKMVDLYVAMIQRGLKTIEQVPERYREQVREVLEQLEK